MSIARRFSILLQVSTAGVALFCGGTLLAQQPAPARAVTSAPAALQQFIGIDANKTMPFAFQDVPVSAILTGMSERFGFVVISTTLPEQHVTVHLKNEVGPGEAVRALNEILEPMGYIALVSNTLPDRGTGVGGSTILRVATLSAGRSQVPVVKGADPDDIPVNDELRTQIIPVDTVTAVGLLNELRPLINGGADMTADSVSNAIVITDTSARIHRVVEIVHALDSARKASAGYQYRQLKNANAGDAAQLINAVFSSPMGAGSAAAGTVTVVSGANVGRGPGRGGSGAGGVALENRLYANADARTNMVILSGPDDQMEAAWDMLTRIDAIPSDELSSAVVMLKRLHYADASQVSAALNQIFGSGGTSAGGAATSRSTGTGSGLTMNRSNGSGLGGMNATRGANRGGG